MTLKKILLRTKNCFGLESGFFYIMWSIWGPIMPKWLESCPRSWIVWTRWHSLICIKYLSMYSMLEVLDWSLTQIEAKQNPGNSMFQWQCYTKDTFTRRSMSGFELCVLSVPQSWQPKSHRRLTLSTPEAKWMVLSHAVKEMICNEVIVKHDNISSTPGDCKRWQCRGSLMVAHDTCYQSYQAHEC